MTNLDKAIFFESNYYCFQTREDSKLLNECQEYVDAQRKPKDSETPGLCQTSQFPEILKHAWVNNLAGNTRTFGTVLISVLFMTWQIGNYQKINCVIFNTIQGVFALSSYLDGLQPVFIYRQTALKSRKSRFQVEPGNGLQSGSAANSGARASVWAFPVGDWERGSVPKILVLPRFLRAVFMFCR
ncbi:hypothetical protein [Nostoc sp.]|uniref:hypothetical protein n=1 Tax=Nostoc sp. TaxID=1180 RepID=UPI002FF7D9C7